MVSPPKPWERSGTAAGPATIATPSSTTTTTTAPPTTQTSAPSVPARPSSITSTAAPYNNSFTSQFNTSPYAAPYSTYTSPYNRLGSYGGMGSYGMGYGGYSNYGMGYGGLGGGYGGYGYGGMGPMQQPMGFDPNNPSLTQQLEATTQSTFALLQSIVQTFGGFAQMLESTFMATHSSFFAMVGVADQLGQLRNALGSVLGLFGLIRWLRSLITGKPLDGGLADEFGSYLNRPPGAPPLNPNAPKPSKKPIIIFLLGIIGIPFLMHRVIRHLSSRLPPNVPPQLPIDPSKLVFARAAYPFETKDPVELMLREGEIVAILGTADPVTGVEGEWWRGRTRDGREGWFPKAYIEVLGNVGQKEPKKVD
ncbi:hypothetical protein Clacol_004295 [Clathrus columnatus]|uniref:Peroxisomal membrane protein PEX13 n=1 Tax=Clathrus columnatus TaxID=1419009 RepID=A0AAV5AA20_9AGAM|nr:hypothetical protein Clacol_004295 [Clathrus columnatus]